MSASKHERWDWIEHLVPIHFLRVLWDALFPARFRRLVLEGLDGSPSAGYARPLTFCLGCWLLLFAVGKSFPWVFSSTGISAVLRPLPAEDRRAVAHAFALDSLPTVTIADTGFDVVKRGRFDAVRRVNQRVGRRIGRVSAADVAQYLESHGQPELGLRVRGYASRQDDRPGPLTETTIILFVVFGLVPGWWISHKVLASRRRTPRETRYVHMYNDSFLVVYVLIPYSLGTYLGEGAASPWPRTLLGWFGGIAFVYWLLRTPWIFRATHDAPVWRSLLAQVAGFAVAVTMVVVFTLATGYFIVAANHYGF